MKIQKASLKAERIRPAEQWETDIVSVVRGAGFVVEREVDMTACDALIAEHAGRGIIVSHAHCYIRAVALVLAKYPDMHVLVGGYRRLRPNQVDIGVSVASTAALAPIVVVTEAARKGLSEIADELMRKAPAAIEAQQRLYELMDRFWWLMPFRFLRRIYLLRRITNPFLKMRDSGTFQVSCLSSADRFTPFLFGTTGALGVGRVRERAVVRDGILQVRQTAILSLACNHAVWDGHRADWFLNEVASLIESAQL